MYSTKLFPNIRKAIFSPKQVASIQKYYCNATNAKQCDNNLKISEDYVHLSIKDRTFDYPHVWLRDNCQCEKCFHPHSNSRIIDWKHFDVKAKPVDTTLKDNTVQIRWSDDHFSIFDIDWLNERSFDVNDRRRRTETVYKLNKVQWKKSDFVSVLKKFDYKDVMVENDKLRDWLKSLSVYGVALVTGVPPSTDSCRNLANRVEFIKRTHYGEEFTVQNKPDTTNVAYLSSNLQPHTDIPYYEYKPGVNLLHCLTQSKGKGGNNLLCDGLYVANTLKKFRRENYDLLTKIEVDWEDLGEENGNRFHSIYRSPVICENGKGDIVRINCSIPQRGSHFDVPVEMVKPWYESFRMFVDKIYEESAEYKMSEGEILCFDNRRLLHGRTEYKDTSENVRHVIGVYLDWDFINSRIRILNNT